MAQLISNAGITFESGYFILTDENGRSTRYPIADMLRAADIPALTYSQVASIKAAVNLIVILIRTLISRQVLDEDFEDDAGLSMSLDGIIEAVEAMGGDFGEPTLEDADA